MKILALMAILLSTVFIVDELWAAKKYTLIAAGCSPASETVQGNRFRTGGHGVFVRGSAPARFFCPIPFTRNKIKSFDIYYKDPDGTGSNYEVKAFLERSALGGRTSPEICGVSSNSKNTSGYTSLRCEHSDFYPSRSQMYWVRFEIFKRAGMNQDVEVLGIRLNLD